MKEQVRIILERELNRLDHISRANGLDLSGFKALDLLIKCHSTFVGPPAPPDEPVATSPEASPTEALLEGLETSDESESESK